jgi:exodeoxyribonuclease V alpha subunit
MNRNGVGVRSLNIGLQQALNLSSDPRVERFGFTYAIGDKVIQTANNYDKDVSLVLSVTLILTPRNYHIV